MKQGVKIDPGRVIAKLLWPELTLNVEGDFWDKYGQDGALGKLTVQVKYDRRIATSGNIWHEIYEKTALHDTQLWRKSPGVADAYIFTSETEMLYLAWFVLIDALAKAEMGLKLTAIFPNNGAMTSLGFLLPISGLVAEKRIQHKAIERSLSQCSTCYHFQEFGHCSCRMAEDVEPKPGKCSNWLLPESLTKRS